MSKIIFPILTLLLFWGCLPHPVSNSTTPPLYFLGTLIDVKFFGGSDEEVAREIIELQDGGYGIVGSTKSTDGDFSDRMGNDWDLFLIKIDEQGEVTWKKTYGGSADDFGFSLVESSEGGFVLMGYSNSQDGDVPPTNGYHDNWIIRVDAAGAVV